MVTTALSTVAILTFIDASQIFGIVKIDTTTTGMTMIETMATGSPLTVSGNGLVVDGIYKAFGPVVAVDALSFAASPGEIIGLLGPNGAGKTTTMRILSTILPPTRGTFSLNGISSGRPAEIRRRIGVLPESSGYPLHWTGSEYLNYYARLYGLPAAEARRLTSTLLSEIGLAERARSTIGKYSRGMRQRLGVARALVNNPSVLLLDEPTLGLDPAGQRQMLGLIRDVAQRRGATIILSTHFLDEVEDVCTRVIILNKGKVIAEGSIAAILQTASPKTCRIRVAPDSVDAALAVLSQAPGVAEVEAIEVEEGILKARFGPEWVESKEAAVAGVVRALAEARILVLSFDLHGGSLSEAFLALTGGVSDD
jgi:ABC-2 type transport system ATP-binding protein